MSCQSKCGVSKTPQFVSEAVITLKSSQFHQKSFESHISIKNIDYGHGENVNTSSNRSIKSNAVKNPPSLKIISKNTTGSRSYTNLSKNDKTNHVSSNPSSTSTFAPSYNSTKSAPDLRTLGCPSSTVKSSTTFQRTVGKQYYPNFKKRCELSCIRCCSRHSAYWQDRYTGNRWIVSLWTSTPHQQPSLDYTELQGIEIQKPIVYYSEHQPATSQKLPSQYLELQKRESDI
ncbi:uncharacterized protein LOC130441609 isoform X2 [Diorhabda sublineata]|uniref:uncharacterized protein LOC130441609 isoform X2 n=1 Tax=Diorhabda sublineata TaxID=1163346 RepID=UPI0024E0D1FD|nr:uncharacterized protein LOC130441609 isoform X2 [Diorhabda sublineata]